MYRAFDQHDQRRFEYGGPCVTTTPAIALRLQSWPSVGGVGRSAWANVRKTCYMKRNALGIATGGEERLRRATEAQVRREHQDELSDAPDHGQKAAIEEQIEQ